MRTRAKTPVLTENKRVRITVEMAEMLDQAARTHGGEAVVIRRALELFLPSLLSDKKQHATTTEMPQAAA